MRICMHPLYGPTPQDAPYGVWRIVHTISGDDISHLVIYADDETGELWRFVETRDGIARLPAGAPEIEKLVLGPGALRLEPAAHLRCAPEDFA